MSTDRIEKQIVLRAPRARVWRAITDHREFGTWFRVALEAPFVVGARVLGQITHPGFTHLRMTMVIERIAPEHRFAFRWHPYAVEPEVDYSVEPMTLVEFELTDVGGGTRLTLTESGFDALPGVRRELAFNMNDGGWTAQMEHVRAHVER